MGRIVSDNDRKFAEKGVLLEASRSMGSGARIPLDLSACPSYAMFPGQLVCLEGTNPDGSAFHVSEQKQFPCLAPKLEGETAMISDEVGDFTMIVASGPFTLDGALDFGQIDRLLLFALERKPDLLVLVHFSV